MKAALVVSSSLALASAVCHHGTKSFARRAEDIVKPNFGYTDLMGPVVWQGLSAEASVCATGQHQSPIAINRNNSKSVDGSSLKFDVQSYPNGAEFLNLGTTLEVLANGSMSLDDEDYSLVQYHIHTPSEHRINEEYYPMEVHFVFQAKGEFFCHFPFAWCTSHS
jgi:carbonic anhydrase